MRVRLYDIPLTSVNCRELAARWSVSDRSVAAIERHFAYRGGGLVLLKQAFPFYRAIALLETTEESFYLARAHLLYAEMLLAGGAPGVRPP